MKTDVYTKTVLTVIAVSLFIIAMNQLLPFNEARAGSGSFATVPVNPDGSIKVTFSETMKVNIAEVGGNYIYGSMPINIKELNGSSISSSYGLPVNIEAVDGSSVYGALPVKEKN